MVIFLIAEIQTFFYFIINKIIHKLANKVAVAEINIIGQSIRGGGSDPVWRGRTLNGGSDPVWGV